MPSAELTPRNYARIAAIVAHDHARREAIARAKSGDPSAVLAMIDQYEAAGLHYCADALRRFAGLKRKHRLAGQGGSRPRHDYDEEAARLAALVRSRPMISRPEIIEALGYGCLDTLDIVARRARQDKLIETIKVPVPGQSGLKALYVPYGWEDGND